MIDLHCHLLPGCDDGAEDIDQSLEMARLSASQGVTVMACTPHIFPGVYDNRGPDIRQRTAWLQTRIDEAGIPMRLVTGGDVHVAPDLVAKLKAGEALALNDSRYVLVEPPHHILPPNMEGLFFNLLSARYVPILTHPERMTWIDRDYDLLVRLVKSGVWMQITAGAILGKFGSRAKYWSERMLDDGMVHIVASDAHGPVARAPLMGEAREALNGLVGEEEAMNLVLVRPRAIIDNLAVAMTPPPPEPSVKQAAIEDATVWGRVARYFGAR